MLKKKPVDFWILLIVLILVAFGVVMVFSASAPFAYNNYKGDTYYFLKSQMKSAILGFIVMFIMMNVDYRKLGKFAPIMLVISIVLLILVKIPGIGSPQKGAWRWIYIGGQSFQPSEFAKLSIILFFSFSLSNKKEQIKHFFTGLLPYLVIIGIFAALLLWEPHLSGTMIVTLVACIILFSAGAKISHFTMFAIPASIGLATLVTFVSYMRDRVLSFYDPFADARGDGYQAVQSLIAIGSGGIFGKGLGKSVQKYLYIPEAHNDFVFSIIAEELGLIGVIFVLTLFLLFMIRGIKVAMKAPDMFGSLLAIGITSQISIQAIFNIAVVTSSMPPTGISLPFLSYGGTSLLFLMCGVGILLNISRYANYERL